MGALVPHGSNALEGGESGVDWGIGGLFVARSRALMRSELIYYGQGCLKTALREDCHAEEQSRCASLAWLGHGVDFMLRRTSASELFMLVCNK